MKSILMTAAALSPMAAIAHPGSHTGSFLTQVGHFFSQPDHLAGSLAAALAAGIAIRWIRSRV